MVLKNVSRNKDVSRNSLFPMMWFARYWTMEWGFRIVTFNGACTASLVLARCRIPLRWHHVFIPACSLPEPSTMKLLLISFEVTTNACLWEFSKTHTIDVNAHLQYLSMEGSFGLTLGSTKPKRTGACSVFDIHWLIILRTDSSQAWVF